MRNLLLLLILMSIEFCFADRILIKINTNENGLEKTQSKYKDYSIRLAEIDTTTPFYDYIRCVLDTITIDRYFPNVCYWYIAGSGDSVISSIEDAEFVNFSERNERRQVIGAIDYKSRHGQRYFILATDSAQSSLGFINKNFRLLPDSLNVCFDINVVSGRIIHAYYDIVLRHQSLIINNRISPLWYHYKVTVIPPRDIEHNFLEWRRVGADAHRRKVEREQKQ